ncbi:hypothetical protein [Chryseobacterium koreense]|uniref:Lipoprotein n=1 Tax=Chryseobacterium koreense CCUG 49689 TaxID=1304281 RepID=A0A0J7IWS9_9FLAO|nr:hypothetical protein [Chryseobacterium koreense]KMQ70281.1 hypothetical protein ACM44_13200 [Chryseobacterium koreense CCUG 49689]MBB5332590.1 hypothetical protein [Chryseobacterium koreense]
MKKTAVLILLFQLFISCNGLNNKVAYSQKLESGYSGPVKKVTTYICEIKRYGQIPTDTTSYKVKMTTVFDSLGNILESNSLYKLSDYTTETSSIYSGTGKNRTVKEKAITGLDIKEDSYQYIWSDDYNFMVVPMGKPAKSDITSTTTLDSDFRVLKTQYKRGDTIRIIDEFEYRGKQEKIHKRTVNEGESNRIIYQVMVTKEYDQHGNPTVTYLYVDPDKTKLDSIVFTKYEYDEK